MGVDTTNIFDGGTVEYVGTTTGDMNTVFVAGFPNAYVYHHVPPYNQQAEPIPSLVEPPILPRLPDLSPEAWYTIGCVGILLVELAVWFAWRNV